MITAEANNQLQVTITAQQAQDVFAYVLRFTFDALHLKLIKATSGMQGLSVEPINNVNQLWVAHTQIGKAPGKNGDFTLVFLTFE